MNDNIVDYKKEYNSLKSAFEVQQLNFDQVLNLLKGISAITEDGAVKRSIDTGFLQLKFALEYCGYKYNDDLTLAPVPEHITGGK